MIEEQRTKAIKMDLAKLETHLEDERKRNEELLTSLRYLQADFENYRKRVDREIRELEEFSTLGLMRKLVPVLDDLELAVASAGKAQDKGLLEGFKMVQKNLVSALENLGYHRPVAEKAVDAVRARNGATNFEDALKSALRELMR